ncbi:MAG TPA: homoserine dehydrogenase [Tissierellia bacterium]|nr:homoserine dehydrogenase [Tissierellia bacterium]
MINIGLLGFGTVGTGIFKILESRQEQLKRITGESISIKRILVKNLHKKRDVEINLDIITDNFDDILTDKDITIIIEVTGDLEDSYNYITESLKAGKHVVTANKKVASRYFEEFTDLADKMGLAFLYEGCVGGGIPVIKPLKEQLALNEIIEVKGILNGTCNYILTRMEEGLEYSEALKIAQQLGFAELDPADDVKGIDTRRKLRILGTLALQGRIQEEDILLRGISSIKAVDIDYIKRINSTVRLIGEIRSYEDGYTAIVEPVIVSQDSPFYSVCYEKNAIFLKGDNVGDLIFYGSGAGMLPTGNAVLEDVIDIITGSYRNGNLLGTRKLKNLNSNIKGEYYLRISKSCNDIANIMESIAKEILCRDECVVIMTRSMLLEDITNLLKAMEIKEEEYFLARRGE